MTRGAGDGDERARRLAARLRDNLRRRKAQARSRRAGDEDPRSGLDTAADDAAVVNPPESQDDVAEK